MAGDGEEGEGERGGTAVEIDEVEGPSSSSSSQGAGRKDAPPVMNAVARPSLYASLQAVQSSSLSWMNPVEPFCQAFSRTSSSTRDSLPGARKRLMGQFLMIMPYLRVIWSSNFT